LEKISVIVPVYNVEKYLKQCIDSILQQTYKNLEIILVDDGSTDSSGNICDEYREKEQRIKVIHKSNGGLSDARNCGLNIATGDYISFIDSDDFISKYFYEIVMEVFCKSDVEIVAIQRGESFWDSKDNKIGFAKNSADYIYNECSSKDALKLMLYQKIATGAPFKVCKRELFKNIRFPIGYYYEDVATTYKYFLKAKRVAIIDAKLYGYRKRHESIIRQEFSEKKMSAVKIFEEMLNDEELRDSDIVEAVISRTFAMMFSVFLQVPYSDKSNLNRLWFEIKKCRKSVLFNKNKNMRLKNRIAALVSYLGKTISYYIGKKIGQKSSMQGG